MSAKNPHLSVVVLGLALSALLALSACAPEARKARGVLDTPAHHTLRGHDLIDEGNWEGARREFELALSLDAEHGPAQAGLAVVTAHEASRPGLSAEEAETAYEQAVEHYEDAVDNAEGPGERRVAHVAAIRVHTMTGRPEDQEWLEEAEDHYEDAIDTEGADRDPAPHFYMARARRRAFQLNESVSLYQRVLSMDEGLTRQADRELAVVQKVMRAQPGSPHGRTVAFLEEITRADVAALFVSELRLPRLYTRGNVEVDTRFQPSGQDEDFQTETVQQAPAVTDVDDHPLRADIMQVVNLGVVGLEPDPAHRFHPDEAVTRAEFALMVEDILVKVTGEQGVRTRHIGTPSPFPDVRNDLPYYNAVQTVVTRNLMEPADPVRGMFEPLEPVAGATALLVIRQLQNELRSYLRS